MEAKIVQFTFTASKHCGNWYITDWAGFSSPKYLHSDGKWREKTKNGGEYTGFYTSKDEAEASLAKWRASQGEPT